MSLLLASCSAVCGSKMINTDSTRYASLEERAEVLHEVVTFRRTYEALDFTIRARLDNGFPPGPSSWDIRVVARVPADELQAWVPDGVRSSTSALPEWVSAVPTDLDLSSVTEWYVLSGKEVGLDRRARIVAYHLYAD